VTKKVSKDCDQLRSSAERSKTLKANLKKKLARVSFDGTEPSTFVPFYPKVRKIITPFLQQAWALSTKVTWLGEPIT
jgi:hypothetical protein